MMAGANPAAGQRIMRHSDPRITTEVYGHLAPDYLRSEVNRLRFGLHAADAEETEPKREPVAAVGNSSSRVPNVSQRPDQTPDEPLGSFLNSQSNQVVGMARAEGGTMTLEPHHYQTKHARDYEPPKRRGYASIECLSFLKGLPWDERALDFVHALRPSCIRVVQREVTCDAILWRVTVEVDGNDVIQHISQEVEVGCRTAKNGHELMVRLAVDRRLATE